MEPSSKMNREQGIGLLKGNKTEAQNLGTNAGGKHIFLT